MTIKILTRHTMAIILCCLTLSGCEALQNAGFIKPTLPETSLKPDSKYPQSVLKNIALETCKSAVSASLYNPKSFDQDIANTTLKITSSKGVTIKIPFTAKTGAGNTAPQIAYCVIDEMGEIVMLNITHK